MTDKEYEQKKRECWEEYKRENLDGEVQWQLVSRYDVFCAAFDRAYALGKQETNQEIKQETDAEGEEMLMISRKKVQRRYHMAYKCKHSVLLSHDDVQFWKGWQGALDDLFGSKCLPDEKVDPESLVTTIKDSMEHPLPDKMLLDGIAEPKPAEPKFKVGDKVRTMKVMSKDYVGKVGTINCQDDGGYIVDYDDGSHVWSAESDLEPYAEPEKNIAEKRNLSQDCDNRGNCPESVQKTYPDFGHLRLTIAAQMMQGLICAPLIPGIDPNPPAEYLAQTAFRLADALIAEAEKGGDK